MDTDIVSSLLDKLLKVQSDGNLALEADLCFKLGLCLKLSGDLFQACRHYLAALELAQDTEKSLLATKCCEELCRVYIYQGSVPHYEYYLNRITAIMAESKVTLCLHHVMDAGFYAYITQYASLRQYLLDLLKGFINRVRNVANSSSTSIEFIQCLSLFNVLENRSLEEGSKNLLVESLVNDGSSPIDKYYSSLVLGLCHLQDGKFDEALNFFEIQNHSAKALQNVPIIKASYYFLLKGHLCKGDIGLAMLSHQLLREVCKEKAKICGFVNKSALELMNLGRKFIGEPSRRRKNEVKINEIDGVKTNAIEQYYFKHLLYQDDAISEMTAEADQIIGQLKKWPDLKKSIYVFEALYMLQKELRNHLQDLGLGKDVRSRCFRCKGHAINAEEGCSVSIEEALQLSHEAFANGGDCTEEEMIFRDLVLVLQRTLRSSEYMGCMGKFLEQLSRDFKDPAEGFDYFSSRKVSKTVMSFVGGNFNMKSRAGEGFTGLEPNMTVRLPSSRIFLPKAEEEQVTTDEEKVTREDYGGGEAIEWIEPTLECITLGTVRMFDFTCLGVPLGQDMLSQLWSAEELRLSCVRGEFRLQGSVSRLVFVLCELTECDLRGCENLGSLCLVFSHVESLRAHKGTRVELIGCEVELEPSMKRMRLES